MALNTYFSKEVIELAHKHRKRCSTPSIIKKMQIKITMTYHLTPTRMVIIIIIIIIIIIMCCWRDGQIGILIHCWEEYEMV